jgi:hypothetical protein
MSYLLLESRHSTASVRVIRQTNLEMRRRNLPAVILLFSAVISLLSTAAIRTKDQV